MKNCNKCKENKPFSDFYRDSSRSDGLCFYCKKCDRLKIKKWSFNTGFYHSVKYRLRQKELGKTKYSYRKESLSRYYKRNPEKLLARAHVKMALAKGSIKKQPCFCGDTITQAHHFNGYKKENWLAVIWLCNEHHRQAHHSKILNHADKLTPLLGI